MFLQNTIRIIAYVGSVYINEEGGEWQIQKEYTNSWIPIIIDKNGDEVLLSYYIEEFMNPDNINSSSFRIIYDRCRKERM